jgi:hypothetical protein
LFLIGTEQGAKQDIDDRYVIDFLDTACSIFVSITVIRSIIYSIGSNRGNVTIDKGYLESCTTGNLQIRASPLFGDMATPLHLTLTRVLREVYGETGADSLFASDRHELFRVPLKAQWRM